MSRTIGHYAPWLLGTMVGALVVLTVVSVAGEVVPWYLPVAAFALALYAGVCMIVHNRRLCERCIASLPLDAAAAAARYALRFRVAHLFERKVFALAYLAILTGSALLYAYPLGRVGWALAEASLLYLLLVYVTHQRLQPWCPRCGNGGQERTAPAGPRPLSTRI
jgi:hypothetical protein